MTASAPEPAEPAPPSGLSHLVARAAGAAFGLRQLAAVRIGLASVWLLALAGDFAHRHELWGPDAPWSWQLADESTYRDSFNDSYSVLLWSDSTVWFEVFYALAFLVGVCLLLGWRSRLASVLLAICVLTIVQRNQFALDNGRTLLRLASIYLVFTRCGAVWSLDARRRARREASGDPAGRALWAGLGVLLLLMTLTALFTPGRLLALWMLWAAFGVWGASRGRKRTHATLDMIGNLVHNGALLMIMIQMCLMYAATGWYKIQGDVWQDGTAVYWPMHIDLYTGWPGLADLVTSNSALVLLMSYGTVMIQVAFPFSLLNARAKNVMLVLMVGEHIGIGLLLGLPVFSATVIACDLVFLPTAACLRLEKRAGRLAGRVRREQGPETGESGPEGEEPTTAETDERSLVG